MQTPNKVSKIAGRLQTVLFLVALPLLGTDLAHGDALTRDQIIAEAETMADAQLKVLGGAPQNTWIGAVMWAGIADLSKVSKRGEKYRQAVTEMGNKTHWTPILDAKKGPYHANDFCIGDAILTISDRPGDASRIGPTKQKCDSLVDYLKTTANDSNKLTWWWCDALFMAPPVLARLSALMGDRKYLDGMDTEWGKVKAALYDKDEQLFYRDGRYTNHQKLTKNGKKVFWSRGNGWVVAGLARMLTWMPQDYPSRSEYVKLFTEMCAKVAGLQRADGTWSPSLLDPEDYPASEFSGTALFCYGMAWGVNQGLLDRSTYLPILSKAWSALLAARRADGLPGYVQLVGYAPDYVQKDGTHLYATGAFIMAALELSKLAPLAINPSPKLAEFVNPAPVSATKSPPDSQAQAFVRFVPERMDDIAWENDRIAHRLYGPALEKHEPTGSGIDVWVKSTRRMVINDWYRTAKYHEDHGEGLDFYDVHQSRGCGGLGIWDDNKLYVSHVWKDYKILKPGPDEARFQLVYAPWDANGRQVSETRLMSLKPGSNLTRVESTITSDKPGDLIVGIGMSNLLKAGKLVQDKEHGIMSYWQPESPKHGTIGCAVLADPALIQGFAEDELNYLLLVKVTPGKPFVYYTGACWSRGLDFKTSEDWDRYLETFPR